MKMESECRHSQFVAAKLLRLPMSSIYNLLQKLPTLKIIHLVRDPRPTMISQVNVGYQKGITTKYSSGHCLEIYHDYQIAQLLNRQFKNRILTVRYESLATNPIKHTKTMYDFLGMEFTAFVEKMIHGFTSTGRVRRLSRYSTYNANSTNTASKWRHLADIRYVRAVDSECSTMYQLFGYNRVDNINNLKNTSFKLWDNEMPNII